MISLDVIRERAVGALAFTEVSEGELYVAETYEVRLSPSLLVWGG